MAAIEEVGSEKIREKMRRCLRQKDKVEVSVCVWGSWNLKWPSDVVAISVVPCGKSGETATSAELRLKKKKKNAGV